MAHMELEFPGDPGDVEVRSRRNISDAERWVSLAAGTALALYGPVRHRRTWRPGDVHKGRGKPLAGPLDSDRHS